MAVRRPWEITPEERVGVGEALASIPEDVWIQMDYYLGFLAAEAYLNDRPKEESRAVAGAYLGLSDAFKAVVQDLPNARREATRQLDPRRLRAAVPEGDVADGPGDEPTPEELRDAAARAARLRRG